MNIKHILNINVTSIDIAIYFSSNLRDRLIKKVFSLFKLATDLEPCTMIAQKKKKKKKKKLFLVEIFYDDRKLDTYEMAI